MSQIIPVVVTQHVEEAAFLWRLRDRAVIAPHYNLIDLQRLDHRVEAHLDGLRVAGEPGWEIVLQQLDANQAPGEVFVAAFVAFETKNSKGIEKVLEVAAPVAPLRRAVIAALAWLPQTSAERQLAPMLSTTVLGLHHIALGGAVAHRMNPGTSLERALANLDYSLRARALRSVGIMGYAVWTGVLKKELRSPDLGCRFAAASSLARFSAEPAALGELQTIVLAESRYRLAAVNWLMRRLEVAAARRVIRTLERVPGSERVSVFAAGALGDPAEMSMLLEAMMRPEVARVAGEAFSWITGVDLAVSKLEADAPEGFEAGPNEDPLDDRVDLDPDNHLPWPDVQKVKNWWTLNRGQFREGIRHLNGKPISPDVVKAALQDGNQRQRAAAALELGLQEPTRPLFETRAPGFRQ